MLYIHVSLTMHGKTFQLRPQSAWPLIRTHLGLGYEDEHSLKPAPRGNIAKASKVDQEKGSREMLSPPRGLEKGFQEELTF